MKNLRYDINCKSIKIVCDNDYEWQIVVYRLKSLGYSEFINILETITDKIKEDVKDLNE